MNETRPQHPSDVAGKPRELKDLRADESGGIAILLLLTLFVLVALMGMIWNVGEYSVRRQRLQDAADAAAYSSAVWMSRGQNLMTGANMAMVRNASAMGILEAHAVALLTIADNLSQVGGILWITPLFWEEVAHAAILGIRIAPVLFKAPTLVRRQWDLEAYQRQILAAIPRAIEQQRRQIEQFYGVNLLLVKPGLATVDASNGRDGDLPPIVLPLKPSGMFNTQFYMALLRRLQRDRKAWDGEYRWFILGRGASAWNSGLLAGASLAMISPPRRSQILVTSSLLNAIETSASRQFDAYPFTDAERLAHFSVMALATPRSFQGPRPVLRQYFLQPRGLAAYAQAETFNPMNAALAVRLQYALQPWRLWSKAGWDWRPRLSVADGIQDAIKHYPAFGRVLAPDASPREDVYDVINGH